MMALRHKLGFIGTALLIISIVGGIATDANKIFGVIGIFGILLVIEAFVLINLYKGGKDG